MNIAIIPRFRFAEENEYTSPEKCIRVFITRSFTKPTIWCDNKTTQCPSYACRSIEDIYNYTIQRFPETTLEYVVQTLFNLHQSKAIKGWYCADINRFVFRPFSVWDTPLSFNRTCPTHPGPDFDEQNFEEWREYFDTVLGVEWRTAKVS